MIVLDAFHLQGIRAPAAWHERSFRGGEIVLRTPVLDRSELEGVWDGLAEAAGERLRGASSRSVPAVLAKAAERMGSQAVREPWAGALAEESGLSGAALRHVLEGMAASWTEEAFAALLADAFGSPYRPTGFVVDPARPNVRTLPTAPAVAFHRFAGNVPGVGVTSAIRSLLVGSAVLARTSASGSLLPALFGRALAEEDEALGRCIASSWWPLAQTNLDQAAMARASLVVAYGGADAIRAVRAAAPAHVRLVLHGPALSVGVIFASALAAGRVEDAARDAALAIATFEQRGCTSPVALLVQRGGEATPRVFAARLGAALDSLAGHLPPGPADVAESARRRAVLDTAALRAGAGGAGPHEGETWGVWESDELRPEDFCTGRIAQIVPFDDVGHALRLLRPLAGRVQTIGLVGASPSEDIEGRLGPGLADLGASRVSGLAEMPWPPATWRHDGREVLRELVNWTDLEPTAI